MLFALVIVLVMFLILAAIKVFEVSLNAEPGLLYPLKVTIVCIALVCALHQTGAV